MFLIFSSGINTSWDRTKPRDMQTAVIDNNNKSKPTEIVDHNVTICCHVKIEISDVKMNVR